MLLTRWELRKAYKGARAQLGGPEFTTPASEYQEKCSCSAKAEPLVGDMSVRNLRFREDPAMKHTWPQSRCP